MCGLLILVIAIIKLTQRDDLLIGFVLKLLLQCKQILLIAMLLHDLDPSNIANFFFFFIQASLVLFLDLILRADFDWGDTRGFELLALIPLNFETVQRSVAAKFDGIVVFEFEFAAFICQFLSFVALLPDETHELERLLLRVIHTAAILDIIIFGICRKLDVFVASQTK